MSCVWFGMCALLPCNQFIICVLSIANKSSLHSMVTYTFMITYYVVPTHLHAVDLESRSANGLYSTRLEHIFTVISNTCVTLLQYKVGIVWTCVNELYINCGTQSGTHTHTHTHIYRCFACMYCVCNHDIAMFPSIVVHRHLNFKVYSSNCSFNNAWISSTVMLFMSTVLFTQADKCTLHTRTHTETWDLPRILSYFILANKRVLYKFIWHVTYRGLFLVHK